MPAPTVYREAAKFTAAKIPQASRDRSLWITGSLGDFTQCSPFAIAHKREHTGLLGVEAVEVEGVEIGFPVPVSWRRLPFKQRRLLTCRCKRRI